MPRTESSFYSDGALMRCRKSKRLGELQGEATRKKRAMVATDKATSQALYRGMAAGKLVSPAPSVFIRKELWATLSPEDRLLYTMRALRKLHPDWVFASTSAAVAHGLSVSYADMWPVRIAVARRQYDSTPTKALVRQLVSEDTPVEVNGLMVTSLKRTCFDCLRELDFCHGLAVADSTLRVGGLSPEALVAALEEMPHNCEGWQHALSTARHADARAESGGESIARGQMIRLGYAVPDLQVAAADLLGEVQGYRADYGWELPDGTTLLGELDGFEKYVNPAMTGDRDAVQVLVDERQRESRISAPGVRVMRFRFQDVVDEQRLRKILDAYGVPHAQETSELMDAGAYQPSWKGLLTAKTLDEARRL